MTKVTPKLSETDGIIVLRKFALFVGVAALGALVTSCGGDESPTPTPTPTDTGTATPTPTPTSSAVAYSVTEAFTAESINANAAFAYFTPDGSMDETFNGASRLNGISGIQFETAPESVTFVFPDLTNQVVFDDTDFVSVTATQRDYARAGEKLTMLLPFTHIMQVSYEQTQDFTRDTTDGTLRSTRAAFFFNRVESTDDVTTTLTYNGTVQVAGGDPGVTASDAISAPDASFDLQNTGSKIVGTIEIYEDVNGTPTLIATLVFDGAINDTNTFSGTLEDTANNFTGSFAGALAGPDREELFILFSISGVEGEDPDDVSDDNLDARRIVGRFIGAR